MIGGAAIASVRWIRAGDRAVRSAARTAWAPGGLRRMAILFLAGLGTAWPAEPGDIALPPPDRAGGRPLMSVLSGRQSIREFGARPVSRQELSDLLWAGFGINRPASGHRTAPSTMNMQEIDLYVALADGLYLYEAAPHRLRLVQAADVRPVTSGTPALREAPAILILVADFSRMSKAKPKDRDFYAAIDAGFISQNVYLYCASAGLATVVHELDRAPLVEAMRLRPEQKIMIAQSIGFAK